MQATPKSMHGFTLIEVMIALLIFSIGLIGLAGLQAVSLDNNQNAFSRTIATTLAYDLADRMRNNPGADYTVGIPGAEPGDCYTSATDCSPTDLRNRDLWEWDNILKDKNSLLNGVEGRVVASGTGFLVMVGWDEARTNPAGPYDCTVTPPTPAGVECVTIFVDP